MKPGRLGVWYAADKLQPHEWTEFITTVEALGYTTQWYSESRSYESMALGSFLLNSSKTLNIGSSIANIYARDAISTANGLYTLNAISGGRYIMGLGVSHIPLVEGLRGHEYRKPVATMREYLKQMHAKLGDEGHGSIVIAALGPKMLELSAELTDGAIPYNVTPEHTATAKAILGPDKILAVEQKVCLETDPTTARQLAKAELERYMGLPNYRNNWRRIGFNEDDLANGGSDRFLDAMVVWGTVETIQSRIQEHFDAGATHVCIQPVHAAGDLAAAKKALRALAPSG